MQVQLHARCSSRGGHEALGGQNLSPVFQLPLKAERNASGSLSLERGKQCYIPLTALAEHAQSLRIFVAADVGSDGGTAFTADCIDMHQGSLARAQGIYQCSSADENHFLAMKLVAAPMQDMRGGSTTEQAGGRPSLRSLTILFMPPLLIKNMLPCTLHIKVFSTLQASSTEQFAIAAGAVQEVYAVNVAKERKICLVVEHPEAGWHSETIGLVRAHRHSSQMCVGRGAGLHKSEAAFRVQFTVLLDQSSGQTTVEAVSPLWVLNKTGLPLELQSVSTLVAQPGQKEETLKCSSTRGLPAEGCSELPVLLGSTCAS